VYHAVISSNNINQTRFAADERSRFYRSEGVRRTVYAAVAGSDVTKANYADDLNLTGVSQLRT